MILKFEVNDNKYFNIKQIAKEYFEMSDRLISKLKNKQLIFKNNLKAYINEQVKENDIVTFNLEYDEENDNIVPIKMDLDILFEDDSLLIINKPPFMTIHPSIGHFSDSLANGVKYYFQTNDINKKIRPVNRLDKDTSGIVIFAKNEYIQESLIKQMQNNIFHKIYLAIVEGCFIPESGTIILPISRKNGSIIEREVNKNGQLSITHYTTLKNITTNSNKRIPGIINSKSEHSLVEFKLETGRTHQIRVHSSYLGHPLLGDTLYGNSSPLINRQALHCHILKFIHPITKQEMNIQSDLPNDMKSIIDIV